MLGRSLGFVVGAFVTSLLAQAQPAPAPAKPPAAKPAPAKPAVPATRANLAQLMKGTLYPASNIIFAAQDQNPADVKPAKDPSVAVNPLESAYGKWEAVENAALTLTEVADLLSVPGRKCSNGLPVPSRNADWPKFVQGLRDAGREAYKAAQSKNTDNILTVAETMTTACANCHDKYREKPDLADRCK